MNTLLRWLFLLIALYVGSVPATRAGATPTPTSVVSLPRGGGVLTRGHQRSDTRAGDGQTVLLGDVRLQRQGDSYVMADSLPWSSILSAVVCDGRYVFPLGDGGLAWSQEFLGSLQVLAPAFSPRGQLVGVEGAHLLFFNAVEGRGWTVACDTGAVARVPVPGDAPLYDLLISAHAIYGLGLDGRLYHSNAVGTALTELQLPEGRVSRIFPEAGGISLSFVRGGHGNLPAMARPTSMSPAQALLLRSLWRPQAQRFAAPPLIEPVDQPSPEDWVWQAHPSWIVSLLPGDDRRREYLAVGQEGVLGVTHRKLLLRGRPEQRLNLPPECLDSTNSLVPFNGGALLPCGTEPSVVISRDGVVQRGRALGRGPVEAEPFGPWLLESRSCDGESRGYCLRNLETADAEDYVLLGDAQPQAVRSGRVFAQLRTGRREWHAWFERGGAIRMLTMDGAGLETATVTEDGTVFGCLHQSPGRRANSCAYAASFDGSNLMGIPIPDGADHVVFARASLAFATGRVSDESNDRRMWVSRDRGSSWQEVAQRWPYEVYRVACSHRGCQFGETWLGDPIPWERTLAERPIPAPPYPRLVPHAQRRCEMTIDTEHDLPAREWLPPASDFEHRTRARQASENFPLEVRPQESGVVLNVRGADERGMFEWRTEPGLDTREALPELFRPIAANRRHAWVSWCVRQHSGSEGCTLVRLEPNRSPQAIDALRDANISSALNDADTLHLLLTGEHRDSYEHWVVRGHHATRGGEFVYLGGGIPRLARVGGRVEMQAPQGDRDEFWSAATGEPFARHPGIDSLPVCRSGNGPVDEYDTTALARVRVRGHGARRCLHSVSRPFLGTEVFFIADRSGRFRGPPVNGVRSSLTCTPPEPQ